MKTSRCFQFVLALACFGIVTHSTRAQVILNPNTIQGTVRFANTNPAILDLLNPPGDEGMNYVYSYASSLPPAPAMSSGTDSLPTTSRTSTVYQITVDSDAAGIAYVVSPRIALLNSQQYYYFNAQTSAVVVAEGPPVTLDFAECLGVVDVNFVNANGAAVAVDGGEITAYDPLTGNYAQRYSMPTGSTHARIYVRGGQSNLLSITINRGTNFYSDRLTFSTSTNVGVICDEFTSVAMVIPEAGDLGQIIGEVNLLGEFELTVDGRDDIGYPDSTGVIARYGPFANQRWAALPGAHFTTPSSGAYVLSNLVASTLDPASPGYMVYAQMYFRTNRDVAAFTTPALGSGANPALPVLAGETVDLTNLFVINPGYLRGQIFLQGPAESAGHTSLLRGVLHAGDNTDADGVPDAIGTYGIYYSSVAAAGVDRLAAGATFTASSGYAYADFPGDFNPASSAYEGQYELVLGGLGSEASIWKPGSFSFTLLSEAGAANSNYFYNGSSITDRRTNDFEIVASEAATNDLAYCFSEVRIVFRSSDGAFYNPQVRFSSGSFVGTDFQGRAADYSVYVDTFGAPYTVAEATNVGQVTLLLPQGTYLLTPSVTPADSTSGTTGLEPINLTVGCGQRLSVEECLRVQLNPPPCANAGPFAVSGSVHSCTNEVTEISYQFNNDAPVTLCTDCGINPLFNVNLNLAPGLNNLTVTAKDDLGRVSFVQTPLVSDTVPPVIECPTNIVVTADRPCGAVVAFAPAFSDSCDSSPTLVCTPPSGSIFPVGDTIVTCTATDNAGNAAACTFTVTVSAGPVFPAPTISDVSPQLLGISGGAQMTVSGAGFTIDDEVLVNGVPLQYPVLVSLEEIQGQAPRLAAGTHQLQIRRCSNIVATFSNSIVTGILPRIVSLDPPKAFAAGGNLVTVHGSNFIATTQVRIGFAGSNLLQNITVSADGTTIIGQVPRLPNAEPLGPRDVIVEDTRGSDLLPAGITYLPNQHETDPQIICLRQLESDSAVPVEIRSRNGFPVALSCRVPIAASSNSERAVSFVRRYRDLFRVANPDADLTATATDFDELQNVKVHQTYRGVPVIGSELSLMVSGDNVLDAIGGLMPTDLLDAAGMNLTPTLSAEAASTAAQQALGLTGHIPAEPPTLGVFDRRLLQPGSFAPRLVWTVALEGASAELYMDAHTGEVVFRNPLEREHGGPDLDLRDARNIFSTTNMPACYATNAVLFAADEAGLAGAYLNDTNVVAGRMHALNTFAFFHNNFEWHSYDNNSSQIRLFVHSTVGNASWSPSCKVMSFRDGWMDYEVMVHELTHGIVSASSQLRYFLESGALDESYSDVMSVLADRQGGETNWTVGENRIGTIGAVRDIPNNATRFWAQYNPGNGTEDATNDFGNVHSNSGIPNYAAFLKATRTRFIGNNVFYPLSESKLAQLKFAAVRSLAKESTFMAARTREITLATEWASNGKHGYIANDVTTVRLSWADVGVGDERDTDRDGMPDRDDNCPYTANMNQADADGDKRGDVCDNCPGNANPGQEDLDQDGKGDACDQDIDGDGCLNIVDHHPNSAVARAGTYISATCSSKSGIEYESEALNHDTDALRDCEDADDDNDGILDDFDPCPLVFGINPVNCRGTRECGVVRSDWWATCLGGGCVEIYARFTERINPDPTRAIIIDRVSIVNQTLYLQPGVGSSVASLGQRIAAFGQRPASARGDVAAAASGEWRIELWSRATETEPSRLVAVVGDYDPAEIVLGQLGTGSLLALNFETNGAPPTLAATWQVGANPALASQDSDADGLPDGWESQHGLNAQNPADALADADADGASNLAEFQAGTDPEDAASIFRVLGIERSGGQVQVEFVGTPGRRFKLERSLGLNNPQWLGIGSELVGQGGAVSLGDTNPPASDPAFYRLNSAAN